MEGALHVTRVIADAGEVLSTLIKRKSEFKSPDYTAWLEKISEWKKAYPVNTPEKHSAPNAGFTLYAFIDALSRFLPESAFIAPCSSGTTAEIFFQAFTVKSDQVIRSNHGLGAMGFELPNAIGMCIANGGKPVVCIAGDGGIQLNVQEFAVICGRNLPIKVFVINNRGYASIRNMQNNHFAGRHVGCDINSGLYLPDIKGLAAAYGISYFRADSLDKLDETILAALTSHTSICEIFVSGDCLVEPRTATRIMPDGSMRSSLLENQFPFLPEEEVERNRFK
jgi:acetolactate synthase-1/2/3 large subunit